MNREAKSEGQLVRKALRGDRKAFEGLVRKYASLVGSIAYSVTGDSHVAEDVVQETFQKAYLRLRSLRDPSSFGSWLYGIARTTSVDWVRKHKARRSVSGGVDGVPVAADERPGPDERAQREEENRIVREALFELPENYREVLVLKHMRDEPYSEVARFLGTTVPAVESMLFRARAALRQVLKRHGIGPASRGG